MSIPADGRRAGPAADVGRWFSTAAAPPPARSLSRTPAWGPVDGAEYGLTSGPDELEFVGPA